jgi:uncharacterized protein (DUF4415 family)
MIGDASAHLPHPACKKLRMENERKSGSFPRAKRLASKGKRTKRNANGRDAELEALIRMRDDQIDTSDIPEVSDWSGAVVGKFYRPIEDPVTLRIDRDVLAWLKSAGPRYQTRINALLRTAMSAERRRKR